MQKMLSESDNTAFFILIDYLDSHDFNFLLDYYPLDFDFYNSSENNTETLYITTKGYSNIFRSLYLSTILNAQDSEYILELLKEDIFDIKILAKLPEEIKVVHKFGLNYVYGNKIFHDCGIMYIPEKSRILYCIMTSGLEQEQAEEKLGTIVNKIYNYR